MFSLTFYNISRHYCSSGGYFLPLKIWYSRLTRAQMNIPTWIRSEYVIYISNSLLSFVWRVSPSEKEGSRLALWFPVSLIYHILVNNTIISSIICTLLYTISNLFSIFLCTFLLLTIKHTIVYNYLIKSNNPITPQSTLIIE